MKIKIKFLEEKYSKGAIIDHDFFFEMMKAQMHGCSLIDVPQYKLDEMERKSKEYLAKEKSLFECYDLNNKGIAYEKEGKLDSAVSVYEKNIALGHPAHHSFKRLMIIYKKRRDSVNEHRVILRALDIFPNFNEYVERLDKVNKLVNKSNP
ncbi:MAG: hypothetical protein WC833_08865 [Bacteroidales bacterium]|jgi:tetratricopeptide (TPR) repeat protein